MAEATSSWDDKIKHLDPQVGSQYDLIALNDGVPRDTTIYDCVRYVARTLKEEMGFEGNWIAPNVESFVEQPDTQKEEFGWHLVLHLTQKRRDGAETAFTVRALLRQIGGEWFMVKSD